MKNEKSDSRPVTEEIESKKFMIRVWDIPTRLFHWVLVGLVICSLVTGNIGLSAMQYHEWSGVAIIILIGFRLAWGFVGGQHSRFKNFIKGPRVVVRYASSLMRKDSNRHIGHNPLGGWSVIAMLTSLLIQAGTGLFANDNILTEGPLYYLVSKETSDWLTGVHHLNKKVLIGLVIIHICAVLFYLMVKRDNLIKPMITGKKIWNHSQHPSRGNPLVAFIIAAAVTFVAYFLIY